MPMSSQNLLDVVEDVAGEQDRRSTLHRRNEFEHLATPSRVKGSSRLVQEQKIWFVHDGCGQSESLEHSAGVPPYPSIGVVGQSGCTEHLVDR